MKTLILKVQEEFFSHPLFLSNTFTSSAKFSYQQFGGNNSLETDTQGTGLVRERKVGIVIYSVGTRKV